LLLAKIAATYSIREREKWGKRKRRSRGIRFTAYTWRRCIVAAKNRSWKEGDGSVLEQQT